MSPRRTYNGYGPSFERINFIFLPLPIKLRLAKFGCNCMVMWLKSRKGPQNPTDSDLDSDVDFSQFYLLHLPILFRPNLT